MSLKDQINTASKSSQQERDRKATVDKIESFISNLDTEKLESIKFIIKQDRFHNKPRNAEELHTACRVLFGFNWPTTACSPENNPPFEWIYDTYFNRYSMTLTLAPRSGGKCLKHDTLIPTPTGMVKISDLKVGDYVYGEDGKEVEITYHSGLMLKDKSYKVTFDNGSEVITDGEHLWKVTDYYTRRRLKDRERYSKKSKNTGRVAHNRLDVKDFRLVTTESMLQEGLKVQGEYNFKIQTPKPTKSVEKEYKVDPYVLGYWLGDGTTVTGTITIGKEDQKDSLRILGEYEKDITLVESTEITFKVKGLTSRLKEYGLCIGEKFIPEEYLLGSSRQRLDLLRGLMDSDGSISKEGKVVFHTSSEILKDQVTRLASSLGFKVSVSSKVPKLNGKFHKKSYNVSLGKNKEITPFALRRKMVRYLSHIDTVKPVNYKYSVVSIEEVDNDYVCCIKVDSEESMFLCTESFIPTHNTFGQAQTTYLANNFNTNYDIITTAAILNQSNVSKGYLANFYEDKVLTQGFLKAPTATSAVWKTNSKWHIAIGCLPHDAQIITEDGPMKMCKVVKTKYSGKVKSWNKQSGEIEWKPVVDWFNNGSTEEWLKVKLNFSPRLKGGNGITATGNHLVYNKLGNKQRLDEFKVGDTMLTESLLPTDNQKQILLGGLLGDSSIHKSSYKMSHCSKQEYYLKWKLSALNGFSYSYCKQDREDGYYAQLNRNAYFSKLEREWYPEDSLEKRIPDYVWEDLDLLGIAVWFMDDATVKKGYKSDKFAHILVATHHFNKDERDKAELFFSKKGYDVTWNKVTGSKDQYMMLFTSESSNRLAVELEPYLDLKTYLGYGEGFKTWKCSELKEQAYVGLTEVEIKSIETVTRKSTKYDIEVEDNHNYFTASNVLISNSMRGISGQHPVRLNLDEIEFWPWDAIEQTWAVPQDKNGYRKTWSGFSTRQRSFGSMSKLVNLATEKDSAIKLYQWNVFEIMQRCPTCLCIKGGKVVSEPEKKCFLWNDCISYDQYVYTSNRGPVPIENIKPGEDYVYSWNNGNVVINKVTDHWKVGEKDVYEITTTNRKSLKTTANHPFLVIKKKGLDFYTEWVAMEDITKDDLLVTTKNLLKSTNDLTEINGVKITDSLLQFIGMYIGDGSMDKDRITIAEFKDIFVKFLLDFASSEYNATCTINKSSGVRVNSKRLKDDFSRLGIEPARSHTKKLPEWVYNLSDRQKEALLRGYEISDGTHHINKRLKTPNMVTTYNSTSKDLLRQIRFILVSLGYINIGRINLVRKKGENLVINGKPVIRKNDLYALEVRKESNRSTAAIYSNHARLNNVLDKDNPDFRVEKVVSKKYVGKEPVYDITVENDHNFIAEGIVVHNCKGEKATRSTGWVPRIDAEQLKKTMSEEAWATQYLCSKPSTHGLVMYNFEHSFAKASDLDHGNLIPLDYAPELDLYVCHDPAESKTSFLIFFQIWNGKMVIIDELVDDECYTVDKVKVAIEEHIKKKGYKQPKAVIIDPHRSDAGKQWESGEYLGSGKNRRYNVVMPEMKDSGFARIEPGLELVRTLTKNGSGKRSLYVNPHQCPRLVECIREHHYKMSADNIMYDDAIPSKEYKDGIDTIRYAAIWCVQMGLVGGSSITIYTMF